MSLLKENLKECLHYLHAVMILPYLVVAPSPKGGRGVFASKDIKAGTTVEISPVLVLTRKTLLLLSRADYVIIFLNGATVKRNVQ